MDTTKAANLYSTYPDDFLAYVNTRPSAGQGGARRRSHIRIAPDPRHGFRKSPALRFRLIEQQCKTGILRVTRCRRAHWSTRRSRIRCRPPIIAANGFDALSHALESHTARPHSQAAENYEGFDGARRPMNQGANLWSDMVRAKHCARSARTGACG